MIDKLDKVLTALKYASIALFYIVSLFALFTWITEMNKRVSNGD